MPEQQQRQYQGRNGDGKSWAQWKQELSEAIEELDRACAPPVADPPDHLPTATVGAPEG